MRCLEPRLENYERRRSSACSAASSLASHRSGNGGNGGGGVACIAIVGEEQLGIEWQINFGTGNRFLVCLMGFFSGKELSFSFYCRHIAIRLRLVTVLICLTRVLLAVVAHPGIVSFDLLIVFCNLAKLMPRYPVVKGAVSDQDAAAAAAAVGAIFSAASASSLGEQRLKVPGSSGGGGGGEGAAAACGGE